MAFLAHWYPLLKGRIQQRNYEPSRREALAALAERVPALADLLPRSRVAVNLAYVDSATPLGPGDEIAIVPPVGGG